MNKTDDEYDDFHVLAGEIIELHEQIREMGGPDYSRDLIECPACGLAEDITFSGMLITTATTDEPGVDTMLRFKEIDTNGFECPNCRHRWKLPAL